MYSNILLIAKKNQCYTRRT